MEDVHTTVVGRGATKKRVHSPEPGPSTSRATAGVERWVTYTRPIYDKGGFREDSDSDEDLVVDQVESCSEGELVVDQVGEVEDMGEPEDMWGTGELEGASGGASVVESVTRDPVVEPGPGEQPQKKKKHHNRSPCPFYGCMVMAHSIKPHVLFRHLPWYVGALTACWTCREQFAVNSFGKLNHLLQLGSHPHGVGMTDGNVTEWVHLMNGLLHYIREELHLEDLDSLLSYAVSNNLYPQSRIQVVDVTPNEFAMLSSFEFCNSLPVSHSYSIRPPNCVASLCCWRMLTNLILHTSTHRDPDHFKSLESPTLYSGVTVTEVDCSLTSAAPIHFVDSHLHLDILLSRTGKASLRALEEDTPTGRAILDACVTNCVFPSHWGSLEKLEDDRVFLTFGLHPHMVTKTRINWTDLSMLLSRPRCVGVGEVGLDYTSRCDCKPTCMDPECCFRHLASAQQSFLREFLDRTRDRGKVIVLHCRGRQGQAARDTLQILKELGLQNHRIHRHCFAGTGAELEEWSSLLPNCYFGFTQTFVNDSRDPGLSYAVSRLPIERVLVESDSPWLHERKHLRNTPWNLPKYSIELARLKMLPVSLLLQHAAVNARELYQLP
jgi:TatD DNase family protein